MGTYIKGYQNGTPILVPVSLSTVVNDVEKGEIMYTRESYTHTITTKKQCNNLTIVAKTTTSSQQLVMLVASTHYNVNSLTYLRNRGSYDSGYTDNATVVFNANSIVITMNSSGGSVYAPFGANVTYEYVCW